MKRFIAPILLLACLALMLPQPASAGGLKLKGLFKLSQADEQRIGEKMLEDLRKDPGIYAPDSQDRNNRIVQEVGRKLLDGNKETLAEAPFEYRFYLIKQDEVNAFATPGGYVYVTEGLMKQMAYDRSMVAAVMAHEMGHVQERHVAKGYEKAMQGSAGLTVLGVLLGQKNRDALTLLQNVGGIVYLKFNRDQEEEADRYGVDLAYHAGYDPFGMMRSLQCLEVLYGSGDKAGEWLTDHPSTGDRVKRTETIARESSGHENGYWPIPSPPGKEHPLYTLYGNPQAPDKPEVTKSTSPVKGTGGGAASNIQYKGNSGLVGGHGIWKIEDDGSSGTKEAGEETAPREDPPAEEQPAPPLETPADAF